MLAGRTIAARACAAKPAGQSADEASGEVRVIESNRPVDQADYDLRPALSLFH
jgi:hypothetical protein